MTLVVLDLGGVVVRNAGFAMLQSVSRAPDVAAVRDRWITSPTVCDFERGALDPATFAARLVAEWELTQSPADFLHDFARWITGPYEGAESVVRSLRAHHRVVAFSNSNAVHWTSLAPVIGWFDAVYSSHELGALKPGGSSTTRRPTWRRRSRSAGARCAWMARPGCARAYWRRGCCATDRAGWRRARLARTRRRGSPPRQIATLASRSSACTAMNAVPGDSRRRRAMARATSGISKSATSACAAPPPVP